LFVHEKESEAGDVPAAQASPRNEKIVDAQGGSATASCEPGEGVDLVPDLGGKVEKPALILRKYTEPEQTWL